MQKPILVPQAAQPVVEKFVKKTMFKMIFPFEARNPDELNLAEGDLVQVCFIINLCIIIYLFIFTIFFDS